MIRTTLWPPLVPDVPSTLVSMPRVTDVWSRDSLLFRSVIARGLKDPSCTGKVNPTVSSLTFMSRSIHFTCGAIEASLLRTADATRATTSSSFSFCVRITRGSDGELPVILPSSARAAASSPRLCFLLIIRGAVLIAMILTPAFFNFDAAVESTLAESIDRPSVIKTTACQKPFPSVSRARSRAFAV